jgi:pyruvate phosphate dikinase-like enzyme
VKSSIDFSERFGARATGFRSLMREQVRHVLFVASLYESFILAEDGHLHERVLGKFLEASPREPPFLTRVSSGRQALRILKRERPKVDLVITSPHVGDMDASRLAAEISAADVGVPVVVLGYDRRELQFFRDRHSLEGIEAVFLWQGDARILLAIVRAIEDRLNVAWDTQIGVPVFMVVEDSVRFYSSFLPVIYSEVLNLTQAVAAESGNRLQRMMRARARPKILLSTTFERALEDFETYRETIMGVFSDMSFPKGGKHSRMAGKELVLAMRELAPDVPVALQSSHESNQAVAKELGVGFLLKRSPDFLGQLRHYMSEHLFFGDFVFRSASGGELDRAPNLKTLVEKLRTVPEESLSYHAQRHDFSRWLRARAEFGLAAELRPRLLEDFADVAELRESLVRDIDRYRRERSRGSVNPFQDQGFDGEEGMVQIGGGSLGGKGRGLAFASRLLDEVRLGDRFPDLEIVVPPSVVLGTGVFDEFMDDNDLRTFVLQCEDESETLARILAAPLPDRTMKSLEQVIEVMTDPLAVRSSSLLEDSPNQPLAGVYGTWLLPNDARSTKERLRQLVDAVKRVYASTFSRRAEAFLQATSFRMEEEAMAVIVQKMVGAPHGNRFYPHISGVARSHNYYPSPPAETEDGIAAVALGLGKTVAQGEPCLRFVPRRPEHMLEHSTLEGMLENAQREFWALQLGQILPTGGWKEEGPLHRFDLKTAERDGTLGPVGSSYSHENRAIYDGLGRPGVRLVSFAPILKHGAFPLAEIIDELLALGRAGTRLPVEIEFAATVGDRRGQPSEFGFLQLRPLALTREDADVELTGIDADQVFCDSPSVLGHGRIDTLRDWIVVNRNDFERAESVQCAEHVASFNTQLNAEGKPYGLIGVGRWGSTHPWLGIPVKWEDISGARVIVEAGFRDARVTPSQGTHFYQNLASLNVGYFTVNANIGEGSVDWDWLRDQPEVSSRGCVRHVRLRAPAVAIMNGHERCGVLLKPNSGAE